METLEDKIVALRREGKTYPEIQKALGCSKSTISYYLSEGGKERVRQRQTRLRQSEALMRKTEAFRYDPEPSVSKPVVSSKSHRLNNKLQKFHKMPDGTEVPRKTYNFTAQDVREKFGPSPKCYLTGEELDYDDLDSLSFDHIVPRARGGENTLENLGLTTKLANRMKSDMTVEELLNMCEKILRHHGRL